MLLCIDVGNTNITFGVYDDTLINYFDIPTNDFLKYTSDQFNLHHDTSEFNEVIVSSVVPKVDEVIKTVFNNKKITFVTNDLDLGIKIKLKNPSELGADLLVGAYASKYKYNSPCIIIDMGTATTITVLNKDNEFLGGVIYPGVVTSYSHLFSSTSLLKKAEVEVPVSVIGNDTISCLQSGMIYGTVYALTGLIERIKEEIGDCKVIITGGIASFIHPFLNNSIYDKYLLLDGLYYIYKKIK